VDPDPATRAARAARTARTPAVSTAPLGRAIDRLVEPTVAAVLGCSLVAGLHPGRDGRAVTYLPGRRVIGVRVTVDRVAIHVVARYPAVLDDVARQIRAAVAPLTAGLWVDVAIEDLAIEDLTVSEPPSRDRPPVRVFD